MDNQIYQKIEYRGENRSKPKKKMDFKKLKKNAVISLNEVECFLRDFKRFSNYIKLYKILK